MTTVHRLLRAVKATLDRAALALQLALGVL